MNIGIDTDGVLTDLYAYNYSIGKKALKREPDNPMGYDVREMYGLSEKQEFRIGLKYFFKYCKKFLLGLYAKGKSKGFWRSFLYVFKGNATFLQKVY